MPYLITYILKLSISLAVVFAVYWLFLRHLTFYKWNRYFLVLYSLAAFLIPFIDISNLIQNNGLQQSSVVTSIPTIPFLTDKGFELKEAGTNYWMIAGIVLIAGIVVMAIKLLFQYLSLKKIRKSAVLLYDAGMKLYHVEKHIMPFSFGDSIYLNQHLHHQEELKEIIRHEFIHVKEKHSIDIVFGELLCILNWYNPFAWLIRHAIRQNLEFIADNAVLENGIDKKQYQYLLLKVTGGSNFSIASNFNFSSLKKRIAMMNKRKSAQLHLLKFLLILPIVAVVLLAFRNTRMLQSDQFSLVTDSIPARPPKPPAPPAAPRLPSHVRSIHIEDDEATVRLKNGDVETYDLSVRRERNAFQEKYGSLPEAPVYPSIAIEAVPSTTIDVVPSIVHAPAPAQISIPKEYRDFLRRNEDVASVHWKDNPFRMIIVLENGRKESYNLESESDVRRAEAKYGNLPVPPPPPPPAPDAPPAPPAPLAPRVQWEASVDVASDNDASVSVEPVTTGQAIVSTSRGRVTGQSKGNVVTADRISISAGEPVVVQGYPLGRTPNTVVAQGSSAIGKSSTPVVVQGYPTVATTDEVVVQGYPSAKKSGGAIAQTAKPGRSGEVMIPSIIDAVEEDATVILEISRNTSREKLEQMKNKLHERGYSLRFDNIDYNDGKLTAFSATISKGNSKSHFNATDFGKLVISTVTDKNGKEGFRIYVYNGNLTL